MKKYLFLAALALSASACVTQAKYNEAKESEARYYDEARLCGEALSAEQDKNKELTNLLEQLKAKATQQTDEVNKLSKELQRVQEDCTTMQNNNKELLEKLKSSKSKEEIQAMLSEIQALQSELMAREDALFKAERDLQEKQNQLEAQNAKITELTALIEQQAAKMQDIKSKVQNALVGYEGDGLQIESRNGRIYVSLDEKLLFQSGKWNVDNRGKQAIRQLSGVLATQKDIDILVEGHTDNVPYGGNGHITDNWDLSVKRATAIVRILLENKELEASRVMAAGRGEFNPIDTADTKEARQKNRRTEIILTPKLTELLQLFE
ncbi:MAG: OmpA family protein [Paludibacteraceae bacterium]|jgi:chemotaxis protein MotB|nr:OmpA family protein [Paludibacteraceae bacterium]